MKIGITLFYFLLILSSCKSKDNFTAQQIIDKSIQVSGVKKLNNGELSFQFRGRKYVAERKNGLFSLERITKQNDSIITDVLSNDGFNRYINNEKVMVIDSMATKYSESVNSVHYFSVLPLGLNDSAVNKKRLENTTINNQEYYKIKVTFDQEGGGTDFEDVFVYWINKNTFYIDFMAYSFHVNGGGVRFREVRNEHFINQIRLVDYNNYKPKIASKTPVDKLDSLFAKKQLTKLSEINLENIVFKQ